MHVLSKEKRYLDLVEVLDKVKFSKIKPLIKCFHYYKHTFSKFINFYYWFCFSIKLCFC